MYIAAAVFLVYARAWKVGDMEKKDLETKGEALLISPFWKRAVVWIKV